MAKAWKNRKSIHSWLKNRQTIDFLCAWEKRHNPNFSGAHLSAAFDFIKKNNRLTTEFWINTTNANSKAGA